MKPQHGSATFEAGARAMTEALASRKPEAFFANATDPLHAGFQAKAAIHSGPGGMPLMGADARARHGALEVVPSLGKRLAYIHVPFCETRCLYCMFYQNPYRADAVTAYARRLVRELELYAAKAPKDDAPIHAVYFGGGTPTALSPTDMRLVLDALKRCLPLANDCEITLEGRIHGFTLEKMEAALAGGVNRFSLGVQTFNTGVRQSVHRIDDRDTIIQTLEKLCAYDDAAVVIDLIYGFPGQTMAVWEDDLATASSLKLDGIDCYQLNVFEKSPLARYIANGKLPAAATQTEKADFFARSVEYLTTQNWRRISNNHWGSSTRERNIYNALGKSACDCLAFGCGAGGRLNGNSFMMERKLADYNTLIDAGEKPVSFMMSPKPNWHLLRTISADMESGAINLNRIARNFNAPDLEALAAPVLNQWCEAGMLMRRGEWLHQTVAGQYWHVTLAQLLMNWLEPLLPGAEKSPSLNPDMGAPATAKMMTQPATNTLKTANTVSDVASVAQILMKYPAAMRDMARRMPRAMLLKAVKDAPESVFRDMSSTISRESIVHLIETLPQEQLNALLRNPESALQKDTPAHLG